MSEVRLARRLLAEFVGSAFLLAAVVGSGVMAMRLSGGNQALALLCNALPTGAMLVVLVTVFGPVSGGHFNPAVSLSLALLRRFRWGDVPAYALMQFAGAIFGVVAAHAMFELPLLQAATTVRTGGGQWLAEAIATLGLVLTVFGCAATNEKATAAMVGLYVGGAYWFTSSTSFANPAVTIARSLSDTFGGIRPVDVPHFVAGQLAGALAAAMLAQILWPSLSRPDGLPLAPQAPSV